jgi:hypothetical protein
VKARKRDDKSQHTGKSTLAVFLHRSKSLLPNSDKAFDYLLCTAKAASQVNSDEPPGVGGGGILPLLDCMKIPDNIDSVNEFTI